MKRFILHLAVCVCCFAILPMCFNSAALAENIAVGTLGTLRWKIDSEGALTIFGNGTIQNFRYNATGAWNDYRDSIKSVIIQEGITSIGEHAFHGCSEMKSVTMPESLTTIEGWAFEFCNSLQSVMIPESVEKIGTCAFFGCDSLTNVTIPKNVTSLHNGTFRSCSNLTEILVEDENPKFHDINGVLVNHDYSILIQYPIGRTEKTYIVPNCVSDIEEYAFYGCKNLTEVILQDVMTIGISSFAGCTNLSKITVPWSVTSIADSSFHNCPKLLTAGPIGSGCNYEFQWTKTIPAYAFSSSGVVNVILPDGITKIGAGAFSYCTNLKQITIPASVTIIGNEAFDNCRALTDIYYQGTVLQWEQISIGYGNDLPGGATLHCTAASGSCGEHVQWKLEQDGTLTITGSGAMEDYSIYSPSPWYKNQSITSIIITEGVTTIGESSFDSCSMLSRVMIPVSISSIGEWAFYECNHVSKVYYDGTENQWQSISVDSTSNRPLKQATIHCLGNLSALVLPSSVTTIEEGAFAGTDCEAVIIPNSCVYIARHAFENCINLVYVKAPAHTIIDADTFEGCGDILIVKNQAE